MLIQRHLAVTYPNHNRKKYANKYRIKPNTTTQQDYLNDIDTWDTFKSPSVPTSKGTPEQPEESFDDWTKNPEPKVEIPQKENDDRRQRLQEARRKARVQNNDDNQYGDRDTTRIQRNVDTQTYKRNNEYKGQNSKYYISGFTNNRDQRNDGNAGQRNQKNQGSQLQENGDNWGDRSYDKYDTYRPAKDVWDPKVIQSDPREMKKSVAKNSTPAERFRSRLIRTLIKDSGTITKTYKKKISDKIVQDLFDGPTDTYRITSSTRVTRLPFPFKEREAISELFDQYKDEFNPKLAERYLPGDIVFVHPRYEGTKRRPKHDNQMDGKEVLLHAERNRINIFKTYKILKSGYGHHVTRVLWVMGPRVT